MQLQEAFYSVIYTARAPGKARRCCLPVKPCVTLLCKACTALNGVSALQLLCKHADRGCRTAVSNGTMSSSVLHLQKRQNKSFKDGVLRLRSASLLLYDEVDSPCSFLLKPSRGYNSRVTA